MLISIILHLLPFLIMLGLCAEFISNYQPQEETEK
jgi:hypothetical protein